MLLWSALPPPPQGGKTVVQVCAAQGHKEVVELLIDIYNLSATEKDDVRSHCIAKNLVWYKVRHIASLCSPST